MRLLTYRSGSTALRPPKLTNHRDVNLLGILELTVLEYAFRYSPIGIGEGALSVSFAIPEFTDVFVPIGIGRGALSVRLVIPEFTNVFVPIGMGVSALSVSFAIPEFTDVFVPCELR